MLELVNVPDSARKYGFAATEMRKGTFVVLSGTFSAGDISALPAAQRSKPGYASAGDLKLVRAYVGATGRCYPINKHIFVPEGADDDSDSILAGASAVYYDEGEFRTTEYTDLSASTDFGDYLKLSTSGTLTAEAADHTESTASVARVVRVVENWANQGRHRLHFILL
jgi:hypothetical protein